MKIYTVTVRQAGASTPYAIAAENEDAAQAAVCDMLGVSKSAVVSVALPKNEAAQALAKLSRAKPPSPARVAAARENGKKGGRPKSPFDSTFHRDGSVTVWDCARQRWVRTAHPSDDILASFSPDERAKIEAHVS